MDKTTKIIIGIIVAIIVVGGIWYGVSRKPQVTEKEPIKIGAILPLTGEIAMVGVSIQQGIEIAVDEINKAGGVKGRVIKVFFENDEYDNTKTVIAAQKLINIDKINISMVSFVHGAKAVMPILEQAKIPLVVAWDSTEELKPGDYTFSTGFSTEKAGERMANFAFNNLKLRKVAIVFHQDEWSEVIAPAFKKEFQKFGSQVVLEEKVAVGENDFKTIIGKIKTKNVDGIYLPFIPVNTDIFLKQAKELGLNVSIMSGDAMIPDIIQAAGGAAEGVYFTNIYVEDNEIAKNLSRKYIEKYGQEPPALSMVAFGYDVILAIKRAIELTKELTPQGIKDALYKVDIIGVGGKIKINPEGLSERTEKVFQVQNGEAVLVE